MVLLLLKKFVVLKEFWLLLRACDIIQSSPVRMLLIAGCWLTWGLLAQLKLRKSGVGGKAFHQATTFQPLDLRFVTQALERDLCQNSE